MERSRSIPIRVKRKVLERDGMNCVYCGVAVQFKGQNPYSPTDLHFDHVVHFFAGGLQTVRNLVVSCAHCNLTRDKAGRRASANPESEFVTRTARGYFWVDDYTPPRLVGWEAAIDLRDMISDLMPLMRWLRWIDGGHVAATGAGEPICIVVKPTAPKRRSTLNGRRVA